MKNSNLIQQAFLEQHPCARCYCQVAVWCPVCVGPTHSYGTVTLWVGQWGSTVKTCWPISSCTAITEYDRLGGLNNRHLFFTVLEAKGSKFKALVDWVPGEGPFPAWPMAFLLYPHMAERSFLSSLVLQGH